MMVVTSSRSVFTFESKKYRLHFVPLNLIPMVSGGLRGQYILPDGSSAMEIIVNQYMR